MLNSSVLQYIAQVCNESKLLSDLCERLKKISTDPVFFASILSMVSENENDAIDMIQFIDESKDADYASVLYYAVDIYQENHADDPIWET